MKIFFEKSAENQLNFFHHVLTPENEYYLSDWMEVGEGASVNGDWGGSELGWFAD